MAAKIGSLDELEPASESVSNYVERVEMYFEVNEIAADKRVATFLTAVGKKTYGVLKDLVSPAKPKDLSLEDLVKALKSHYVPVTLVIAERFHFHRRCQQ